MTTIGAQMAQAHQALENVTEASANVTLKANFPHIDDPVRAINFALDAVDDPFELTMFLDLWRDGSWSELEKEFPEYLEKCRS